MAGLVVLHVSDTPADVKRALGAASAITRSEPMRVRVIVNGAAVDGLTDSLSQFDIGDGVSIEACERAMKGRTIAVEDLPPGVGTVQSAVIALARAQHEGAAYIRI